MVVFITMGRGGGNSQGEGKRERKEGEWRGQREEGKKDGKESE